MNNVFTSGCKIAAPISKVFNLLCHPENFHHFIPAILEAHWEDESPIQVGKAYAEIRRAFGKRVTARVFISQFNAPTRIAYKSTAAGVSGEYVYSLRDVNGTTHITLEVFAGASGFAKLILPVFISAMKKHDSDQLTNMRNFLEHV